MFSFWHRNILGQYDPQEKWVGFDFRNLFLDRVGAELTYFHEMTHSVLSRSTDFGQATQMIYQLLPYMKHLSIKDREDIKNALMNSQMLVQEGMASLMEILRLRMLKNKQFALDWAKENLPEDYYNRFIRLVFVLDLSNSYKDYFTQKIPHLALHTAIRKKIVEQNLLSNSRKFVNYLETDANNPDIRFQKMIDVIRYKKYLVTKTPSEICNNTGIVLHPDVSKQDVADFQNYVYSLTDIKRKNFVADDIKDAKDVNVLTDANDQIIIGNMNLNLAKDAIVFFDAEQFLPHKNEISAVMVNLLGDELDYKEYMEMLTGRKFEAALVAFSKNGAKYIIGADIVTISSWVKSQFSEATLLVKWGLYVPGRTELSYFGGSRNPDVVVYNTIHDLEEKFEKWFKVGNKAEYLYVGASQDHPFQILILKDNLGVLHLVNVFGNVMIDNFFQKYKNNLARGNPISFLSTTKHYNNIMSIWMGLPWEIDWYKTMTDQKEFHLRGEND